MRIEALLSCLWMFVWTVVQAAGSGETAFSETAAGEVPYWEFGPETSDAVWFQVSRTSTLEYRKWISNRETAGAPEAFSVYLFGLDWDSSFPSTNDLFPRRTEVELEGERYPAIRFAAKQEPRNSRISYTLERKEGDKNWIPVRSARMVSREPLANGLERRVLRDSQPLHGDSAEDLRLRIRYEPVPAIFAHYISDLNPGWGAMAHLMQPTPAFFRLFHDRVENLEPVPRGLPETFASTGGPHRDLPLVPPGFAFSTAEESAKLEIARARRTGLDGFAVNCLDGNTDFLGALFTAAKNRQRNHPDEDPFLLTLSIDINVLSFSDREMLPAVANLISEWLALAKRQRAEEHLARRGGKPLVMGYQSHWIWIDYLHRLLELWESDGARPRWPKTLGPAPAVPVLPAEVQAVYHRHMRAAGAELRENARQQAREAAVKRWAELPDGWARIRDAYRLIERLAGEEIFWQFDAVDLDAITGDFERAIRVVARDFPAVNFFLPKGEFTDIARRIVREQGAEWGEPIYSQYVAYAQNEQDGIFLGNAYGGDGTATFRRGWSRAMGHSSLIQYTTWNDYGEHTHLAPSLQMRYALSELARHFIHAWKTGESVGSLGEQLFLFYRKHPEDAEPFPFRSGTALLPALFEVVSVLKEPGAELELLRDGESQAEMRMLSAGLHTETFEADHRLWREGPVAARILKPSGGKLFVAGWEEITHRPFREDTTLVGASSFCDDLWEAEMREFGFPDFTFSEYGDADGDGLPNWFEMFFFGHGWLNPGDQTRARAAADENRDGVSNRDHFRLRTNPTWAAAPFPYRETGEGAPVPFRIDPVQRTRIQAEAFDRGGAGRAYRRTSFETIQGGSGRRFPYDLPTHVRVDAHEEDGGDWMVPVADGEWLAYTVEIPEGCYAIAVRVRESGGKIRAELGGRQVLEAEIESEGLWSTQNLGRIRVSEGQAGRQILRLHFDSPGYALNWIEFRRCRRY